MNKHESDTLAWLNQGLDRREILNRLEADGLTGSDCLDVFNDVYPTFRSGFKSKNRLKWLIGIGAIVVLFLLLPIPYTANSPIIFSIIFGLIFSIFVTQAIYVYLSWENFKEESFGKYKGGFNGFFLFLLLFGLLSTVFVFYFLRQKQAELDSFGVYANGKLIEMGKLETKRLGGIKVEDVFKLTFKASDSAEYSMEDSKPEGKIKIDSITVNTLFKIKYSSRYPEINQLEYVIIPKTDGNGIKPISIP
jgi:hypothetical protein